MLRALAIAAVVGAAFTGAAVYALMPPPQTKLATEEAWPVCSTMSAVADSSDWAQLDPDFAAGKKALAAGDWRAAIAALALASLRDPRNADIENYVGYAYRRLRQIEPALAHYQRALEFNPRHRGAHEHLGDAYLAQGDLGKAEEHLAALERICLLPCREFADLAQAITDYKRAAMR